MQRWVVLGFHVSVGFQVMETGVFGGGWDGNYGVGWQCNVVGGDAGGRQTSRTLF